MGYRKQLIVIHTVLAAFFLPMGIMYAYLTPSHSVSLPSYLVTVSWGCKMLVRYL